ncbi:hypothetical protein Tco_0798826 [Tanacetum coccineum]
MVYMVPHEAFACRCAEGDVVLRQSYKPESYGKLYYACPKLKDIQHLQVTVQDIQHSPAFSDLKRLQAIIKYSSRMRGAHTCKHLRRSPEESISLEVLICPAQFLGGVEVLQITWSSFGESSNSRICTLMAAKRLNEPDDRAEWPAERQRAGIPIQAESIAEPTTAEKTINDFPARSSLSGWSGQGYRACPTCNEDTPSVRVLGKTAYVGHRRFLKKPHKWRRSLEFNGETKNGDPPREFSRDAIMSQLARLPTRVKDVMHIEKNVLESILNTLLMNDKSKDTAKARQDLKRLGIRSGLWLGQNKNEKCSKPQAAYSFKPEDRKKFCQFIKGVKLPDGFGSNFKHKVTDNDTNITGLKSHDCHIMMQRLLPYGLQQYLPLDVAKPLIELCLFFKQICSQTLMVDDMLKAQSKKLKNYVRNKAKPEGSIAEGYVAEEALTFSSHYFRDVTTKFNRPDRNVDCPPPTCQFQVFKSLCKSIGLRSVIRIDHHQRIEEIDMIRQRHVDNDPGVNESSELFAWACGPSQTPISVNSSIVNGVRFIVHSRDERRTTQNNGICSPGLDGEMYYDQLEQILKFSYLSFKTVFISKDNLMLYMDNSSDLALSTSLNDLEIAALHIDGQSIDVDAPPDIIDVVDEDDDIIDDGGKTPVS